MYFVLSIYIIFRNCKIGLVLIVADHSSQGDLGEVMRIDMEGLFGNK